MEIEQIRKMAKRYYDLHRKKYEIEQKITDLKNALIVELGKGIHDFGDVVIWIREYENQRMDVKRFKMENPDLYSFYTYKQTYIRVDVEIKKGDENGKE